MLLKRSNTKDTISNYFKHASFKAINPQSVEKDELDNIPLLRFAAGRIKVVLTDLLNILEDIPTSSSMTVM